MAFLEAFCRGLSGGNTFASFCLVLTQNSVLMSLEAVIFDLL